ncbi:unnamed protein product [Pedinophyceae sp. YPF-701]|nr:unnamed protein product [Pedinophyceae sp. YPF-701]
MGNTIPGKGPGTPANGARETFEQGDTTLVEVPLLRRQYSSARGPDQGAVFGAIDTLLAVHDQTLRQRDASARDGGTRRKRELVESGQVAREPSSLFPQPAATVEFISVRPPFVPTPRRLVDDGTAALSACFETAGEHREPPKARPIHPRRAVSDIWSLSVAKNARMSRTKPFAPVPVPELPSFSPTMGSLLIQNGLKDVFSVSHLRDPFQRGLQSITSTQEVARLGRRLRAMLSCATGAPRDARRAGPGGPGEARRDADGPKCADDTGDLGGIVHGRAQRLQRVCLRQPPYTSSSRFPIADTLRRELGVDRCEDPSDGAQDLDDAAPRPQAQAEGPVRDARDGPAHEAPTVIVIDDSPRPGHAVAGASKDAQGREHDTPAGPPQQPTTHLTDQHLEVLGAAAADLNALSGLAAGPHGRSWTAEALLAVQPTDESVRSAGASGGLRDRTACAVLLQAAAVVREYGLHCGLSYVAHTGAAAPKISRHVQRTVAALRTACMRVRRLSDADHPCLPQLQRALTTAVAASAAAAPSQATTGAERSAAVGIVADAIAFPVLRDVVREVCSGQAPVILGRAVAAHLAQGRSSRAATVREQVSRLTDDARPAVFLVPTWLFDAAFPVSSFHTLIIFSKSPLRGLEQGFRATLRSRTSPRVVELCYTVRAAPTHPQMPDHSPGTSAGGAAGTKRARAGTNDAVPVADVTEAPPPAALHEGAVRRTTAPRGGPPGRSSAGGGAKRLAARGPATVPDVAEERAVPVRTPEPQALPEQRVSNAAKRQRTTAPAQVADKTVTPVNEAALRHSAPPGWEADGAGARDQPLQRAVVERHHHARDDACGAAAPGSAELAPDRRGARYTVVLNARRSPFTERELSLLRSRLAPLDTSIAELRMDAPELFCMSQRACVLHIQCQDVASAVDEARRALGPLSARYSKCIVLVEVGGQLPGQVADVSSWVQHTLQSDVDPAVLGVTSVVAQDRAEVIDAVTDVLICAPRAQSEELAQRGAMPAIAVVGVQSFLARFPSLNPLVCARLQSAGCPPGVVMDSTVEWLRSVAPDAPVRSLALFSRAARALVRRNRLNASSAAPATTPPRRLSAPASRRFTTFATQPQGRFEAGYAAYADPNDSSYAHEQAAVGRADTGDTFVGPTSVGYNPPGEWRTPPLDHALEYRQQRDDADDLLPLEAYEDAVVDDGFSGQERCYVNAAANYAPWGGEYAGGADPYDQDGGYEMQPYMQPAENGGWAPPEDSAQAGWGACDPPWRAPPAGAFAGQYVPAPESDWRYGRSAPDPRGGYQAGQGGYQWQGGWER